MLFILNQMCFKRKLVVVATINNKTFFYISLKFNRQKDSINKYTMLFLFLLNKKAL